MTVTASNYARAENDLYQTEPWVTRALLRNFPVEGLKVWDPCAGNHLMSDVLKETAKKVVTSDIEVYDREHNKRMDFLGQYKDINPWWTEFDAIIANPPYGPGNRTAVKWAKRSLSLCDGLVALLLTVKFDSGSSRVSLFRDNPRFVAKIVLIDRISWTLDGKTGTEDHAWFVWGPRGSRRKATGARLLYEGRKGQDV